MSDELQDALVARLAFPDGNFRTGGSRDDQLSSACVCHVIDGAGVAAVRAKRVVQFDERRVKIPRPDSVVIAPYRARMRTPSTKHSQLYLAT